MSQQTGPAGNAGGDDGGPERAPAREQQETQPDGAASDAVRQEAVDWDAVEPGAVEPDGASAAQAPQQQSPAAAAGGAGEEGAGADDEGGSAPLGPELEPTGNEAVDATLRRLRDTDHLAVPGHLEVYEDVHRGLRDTLAALDQPSPRS